MKVRLMLSALAMALLCASPGVMQSQVQTDSGINIVRRAPDVPVVSVRADSVIVADSLVMSVVQPTTPSHKTDTSVPIDQLMLLGFAFAGATTSKRKMTLSRSYLFNGQTFGPGQNIEVPEGFPELTDDGDVIHESGSVAERNAARARQAPAPAGTPAVFKTVSGKTAEELSEMNKEELIALADELGLEVTRADGADGEPLVADYMAALTAAE